MMLQDGKSLIKQSSGTSADVLPTFTVNGVIFEIEYAGLCYYCHSWLLLVIGTFYFPAVRG